MILIDGGLGQLHAAMEVFKTMDVKPPMVISLAKKEELVYVQAQERADARLRASCGLEMLQYIRDEAHRFAQHYHHILRENRSSKKMSNKAAALRREEAVAHKNFPIRSVVEISLRDPQSFLIWRAGLLRFSNRALERTFCRTTTQCADALSDRYACPKIFDFSPCLPNEDGLEGF